MFADRTSGFSSDHTSGSMNSSFSSNTWDMAFADASRRDSYDSTFDAVKVENPYCSLNNNLFSTTQDEMLVYANDGNMFPMGCNNALDDYLSHLPSARFPTYPGCMYDMGNHPTQSLALNTNIEMLQANSNIISTQEDFVIPSQTTFLNAFDLNSPMHGPDFDTSPISECPTDYSFGSPEDERPCISSVGSVSSYGSVKSESVTPKRSSSFKHHGLDQAMETSAALHRVQFDHRDTRARHKRPVKRETSMIPSFSLKVQKQAKKMCSFLGCDKKFQRQEHLKRHERTHTNTEGHPCPFCVKARPFSREDNLKSHIKLHCAYKKSARTDFHPQAQEYYDELCRKSTRKSVTSRRNRIKSESSA